MTSTKQTAMAYQLEGTAKINKQRRKRIIGVICIEQCREDGNVVRWFDVLQSESCHKHTSGDNDTLHRLMTVRVPDETRLMTASILMTMVMILITSTMIVVFV